MSYSEAITKNDLKKILGNIGFGSLNDYIIEQGTSGSWNYRKWKSGYCELWGQFYQTQSAYTTGGFIIGNNSITKYPFTIIAPLTQATAVTIGNGGGYITFDYSRTDYWSGIAESKAQHATGTNLGITWNLHVMGKWKNDIETYQGIGSIGAVLLDTFHPVGSYYETSDASFDPNTAWGGTWVKLAHNTLLTSLTYRPNGNTTDIGNITIPVDGYYMFIVGWSNGKPLFAGLSTTTQNSPTQVIYDGTDSGGEYNVVMYMTAGVQKVWVRAQSASANNTFYVYKVNYVDDNVNRWHRTA